MNPPPTRLGLISGWPMALGLVGLWCAGCSRDADVMLADQGNDGERIRMTGTPPTFVFPEEAKTDNPSVNAFIEEFGRLCVQGEYDQYRLKVRRRSDPVSKDDFEQVWHNVSEIYIQTVVALPPTEDVAGPRYAVRARVRMQASHGEPEREVVLQVLQELGQWVIDALPSEEIELLLAATSQPTTASTTTRAAPRTR